MPVSIGQSVGHAGVNRNADVAAVQKQLNLIIKQLGLQPVPTNGMMDPMTIAAIKAFQQKIVKLPMPDGRIDLHGKTLKALNAIGSSPHGLPGAPIGPGGGTVDYAPDIDSSRRIVSDYSIKVVQRALAAAGMTAARITSTFRLPAEQANIMYDMAMKGLQAQYALYGATGDQVLDVFKASKTKSRNDAVKDMTAKIEELAKTGRRVSNHVVSLQDYATLNVFDLGVNSARVVAGPSFNQAGLTKALRELEHQGYIKKFIDETAKKNSCWHLEIVPNAKPL